MAEEIFDKLFELSELVRDKAYKKVEHAAYLESSEILKGYEKIISELIQIQIIRNKIKTSLLEENLIVFDVIDLQEEEKPRISRQFSEILSTVDDRKRVFYVSELIKYIALGSIQKDYTLAYLDNQGVNFANSLYF